MAEEEETEIKPEKKEKIDVKSQREAKKLADEVLRLQNILKQKEDEQLTAQNNFKQLAENKEKENQELRAANAKKDEIFMRSFKITKLESLATSAGMRPEAIKDLQYFDTSDVVVETTSQGNMYVPNAKDWIEKQKVERPYLFLDKKPPNINTQGGGYYTEKKLTAKEMVELEKKDPQAYRAELEKLYSKK